MATDLLAAPIVGVSGFPTDADPKRLVRTLADRIGRLLNDHHDLGRLEGIGVVVPGMVDSDGERVLYAPRLGWRDVPLGDMLAAERLAVHIENSGRACALAQVWRSRARPTPSATSSSCPCPTVSAWAWSSTAN